MLVVGVQKRGSDDAVNLSFKDWAQAYGTFEGVDRPSVVSEHEDEDVNSEESPCNEAKRLKPLAE